MNKRVCAHSEASRPLDESTWRSPDQREFALEQSALSFVLGQHRWLAPALLTLSAAIAGTFYFYVIPSHVIAYQVGRAQPQVAITGPGIMDAIEKVTVTSRVAGFLKSIHVDINSSVRRGELLAELDAKELESQLAAARAEAQAVARGVDLAKSEQDYAVASRDKAAADVRRRRPLAESGTVSQADFEAVTILDRQAQANLQRAANAAERAEAQAAASWAQVHVMETKLAEAKIISPLAAVVVSRERNAGDLLTPGTTLVQLVNPTSIVISARLDESVMGLLRPGQAAKLVFASRATQPILARVMRVGRSVDPETREFVVDISPSQLPENWAIGQRASVQIQVELPATTLAIPQTLIARRGGHAGIWKLELGYAWWKRVELGLVFGDHVEVLSGVARDDILLDPDGRYALEPISVSIREPRV